MIGQVAKFKFSMESRMLDNAIEVIELTEPHEAGEIINNNWMILNSESGELIGKYDVGYWVKIIDLKYCDIIETDINHDNRTDLRKINTRFINNYTINNGNQSFILNVYEVINTKSLFANERRIIKMVDHIGVHQSHCCVIHGCKYGDENCPVVTEQVEQEYPCEYCNMEGIQSIDDVKNISNYFCPICADNMLIKSSLYYECRGCKKKFSIEII